MWLRESRVSNKTYKPNESLTDNPLPQKTKPTDISLLSYNIDCDGAYRTTNTENVLTAIVSADADIVCLQESHGDWEKSLRPQLQTLYPHQKWHEPPPAVGPGGLAVLSKFPITSDHLLNNITEVPESWFPLWTGTIGITRRRQFQLCIVHLRPPLNELGYQWSVMSPFITNKIRLSEVKYLAHQLVTLGTHLLPTVICGDFNENDSGDSVNYFVNERGIGGRIFGKPRENTIEAELVKMRFKDAVHEFVPSHVETHRFPIPFDPTKILRSRLDHVLYSVNTLACQNCRVIPGFEDKASDHMPILSIFHFLEADDIDSEEPANGSAKREREKSETSESIVESSSESDDQLQKSPKHKIQEKQQTTNKKPPKNTDKKAKQTHTNPKKTSNSNDKEKSSEDEKAESSSRS